MASNLNLFLYAARNYNFCGTREEAANRCPIFQNRFQQYLTTKYMKGNRYIECGFVRCKILTVDGDYILCQVLGTNLSINAPSISQMIRVKQGDLKLVDE